MKKDLEDFTVEDFEPSSSKELISMLRARAAVHRPEEAAGEQAAIAERMVAFFREEKEKARVAARKSLRTGAVKQAGARPRIPGIESRRRRRNPRPEMKRARRPRRSCPRRSCRRRRRTIRRSDASVNES